MITYSLGGSERCPPKLGTFYPPFVLSFEGAMSLSAAYTLLNAILVFTRDAMCKRGLCCGRVGHGSLFQNPT